MSRGNAKALAFLDQRDYQRFFELLAITARRFGIYCYAFCLMPNHYHLVVVTPRANLSAAFKHLNGVYSQWWNRRHSRCGHVFQGRFKAQVVQQDRYLAAVCRYVVLNPVRAGLVSHPGAWKWSSYRASAGLEPSPDFLSVSKLLDLVRSDPRIGPALAYRRFVTRTDDQQDAEVGAVIRSDSRFLGDESFLMSERAAARTTERGLPRRETLRPAPTLSELLDASPLMTDRNARIWLARAEFGYRILDIARHICLHPVSVSRILRMHQRERSRTLADRPECAGPQGEPLHAPRRKIAKRRAARPRSTTWKMLRSGSDPKT